MTDFSMLPPPPPLVRQIAQYYSCPMSAGHRDDIVRCPSPYISIRADIVTHHDVKKILLLRHSAGRETLGLDLTGGVDITDGVLRHIKKYTPALQWLKITGCQGLTPNAIDNLPVLFPNTVIHN
jgi:hypothetical protein